MARILLADDDFAVRDFVRRALEMDGHDVVTAYEGGDALKWLSPAHKKFDLLVSDVRMAEVDGIALARISMDDHPDMPVLLMSGLASQLERAGELSAIAGVIAKPFTLTQICAKVGAVLADNCS